MMWQKKSKKIAQLTTVALTLLLVFGNSLIFAQDEPSQKYFTGHVIRIVQQTQVEGEEQLYLQTVELKRDDTGQLVTTEYGSKYQPLNLEQLLTPGRKLVLAEQPQASGEKEIVIADNYRMNTVYWLAGLFVLVVLIVAGVRGISSLLGMFISVGILLSFIVPQILAGSNPMTISLAGSLLIGAVTIYLSHGFSTKSHIALSSISGVLLLVGGLSYLAVKSAQLAGLGSEEAAFLQFGSTAHVNLQGLLLGGILLGALGVLDDIAVSQVSIVQQLQETKIGISWSELYQRSLAVGRDHVASLVNTLVLAYAGANLPLFLLFIINNQTPTWVTLNSDILVEEIVRTLAGSIGLVLAVPLTTFLAAIIFTRHAHNPSHSNKSNVVANNKMIL